MEKSLKNGYVLMENKKVLSLYLSMVDFKEKCREIKIIDNKKLILKGDAEVLITHLTKRELSVNYPPLKRQACKSLG